MAKPFIIRGKKVVGGKAEGEALIADERVSFWGGTDPTRGIVHDVGSKFEGKSFAGKVFIFRFTKGSSGTSAYINIAKRLNVAPAAIINTELDSLCVLGCAISDIPMMTDLDKDPFKTIKNGDWIKLDADEGIIEVTGKSRR
jgi:predicted aconitase with swiveling domain